MFIFSLFIKNKDLYLLLFYLEQIVIMWASDKPPPFKSRWPQLPTSLPLHVLHEASEPGISQRFFPHPLLQTAAILSLDEDALLTTDEVDFAFQVWCAFPERIVGYPARSHYWDDAKV